MAYSAYGKRTCRGQTLTNLGFNGELREASLGWYLLGNGHRAYNPGLMRFHSPDTLSPFGEGGLNAYMYCGGEPVMRRDPTGRSWFFKAFAFFNEVFSGVGGSGLGGVRRTSDAATPPGKSGLLGALAGLYESAKANRRIPQVRNAKTGRRHAAPSWKYTEFSGSGSSSGNAPASLRPKAQTNVFDSGSSNTSKQGNQGNSNRKPPGPGTGKPGTGSGNPSNQAGGRVTTVSTRGGLSITGADSGRPEFASTSRNVRRQ
jgi:RHS repeat-associated protein